MSTDTAHEQPTRNLAIAQVEEIQAQRIANRDKAGRIKNQALDIRLQAKERRIVVGALGMTPEDGDPYAATTGELLNDLKLVSHTG